MLIEYSKDLYHNYMRIKEHTYDETNAYCIRMLEAEGLSGVLRPDCRRLDGQLYVYYDITAKQSLTNLLGKSSLSRESLKQLLTETIGTILKAYEYLLDEKGFLLGPETIFFNLNTCRYEICYLPGYDKDVREQLINFMEFLMNKVDYNDKEAVLLIYNLYAAGKDEGYAFVHMLQIIQKSSQPGPENHGERSPGLNCTERNHSNSGRGDIYGSFMNKNTQLTRVEDPVRTQKAGLPEPEFHREARRAFPVMLEKESREQEAVCYPIKAYLGTAGCCMAALLVLLLCMKTKLCYNALGYRIDYSKLFAILLILFSCCGYLIMKLWDKKNRITKMVTMKEYHDPRQETEVYETPTIPSGRMHGLRDNIIDFMTKLKGLKNKNNRSRQPYSLEKGLALRRKEEEKFPNCSFMDVTTDSREGLRRGAGSDMQEPEEEEEALNPTCLLNAVEPEYGCKLKPVEGADYEPIPIKDFPFFIGKLKKNVDYCLEKEVVSRYHAKITREGDRYYITDLNSTNGTYLNKEVLMTYQQKELKPGDEICFADVCYIFVLN